MAPRQRALKARLLEVLSAAPDGMALEGLMERLETVDEVLSTRGVRDTLNTLAEHGEVVRRRQPRAGPGAPPFYYFHPSHAPANPSLLDQVLERTLDGARASVSARDDFERGSLRHGESERQQHSTSVLMRIAHGMLDEDSHAVAIMQNARMLADMAPVELVIGLARWVEADLNTFADRLSADVQNGREGEAVREAAAELDTRLAWARRYFHGFWRLDREVPGSPVIFEIPRGAHNFHQLRQRASLDVERARERLKSRLIGRRLAETVEVDPSAHTIAAGTDASVADIRIERQATFGSSTLVSVMSAAAALVQRRDGATREYQDFDIFPDKLQQLAEHSAAAHGFVLSPSLRDDLPERDFRHSRMAALDLRQYDEEFRIVVREAKWRPVGSVPSLGIDPRPTIIFRDGRMFPLVHRLRDYESPGLYGQIVRNQIEKFSQTLHHSFSGPSGEVIYGAVVKSPEMSWLAPLVFWHLHSSDARVRGKPVLPDAADVYRPPFADSAVAQLLFLGLEKASENELIIETDTRKRVFRTCIALRRFVDIAFDDETLPVTVNEGLHRRPVDESDEGDWQLYLHQRIQEKLERELEAPLPMASYRPFAYLCTHVGVAMCYGAPASLYDTLSSLAPGENGQFLLPRLETAVDMRSVERAEGHLHAMLGWMAGGGCELSRYTRSGETGSDGGSLPVLVPDVIAFAHDAATFAKSRLTEDVEDRLRDLVADLRRRLV